MAAKMKTRAKGVMDVSGQEVMDVSKQEVMDVSKQEVMDVSKQEVMDVESDKRLSTSAGNSKNYSAAFSRAKKRRKTTLKRKLDIADPKDVVPSENNMMICNVKSSTQDNLLYDVSIKHTDSGFALGCTCGHQYGVPTRNSCKHVGNVIVNMMHTYLSNYFKRPIMQRSSKKLTNNFGPIKDFTMDQLELMFNQFMQINEKR